jgi:hypothetical protein
MLYLFCIIAIKNSKIRSQNWANLSKPSKEPTSSLVHPVILRGRRSGTSRHQAVWHYYSNILQRQHHYLSNCLYPVSEEIIFWFFHVTGVVFTNVPDDAGKIPAHVEYKIRQEIDTVQNPRWQRHRYVDDHARNLRLLQYLLSLDYL